MNLYQSGRSTSGRVPVSRQLTNAVDLGDLARGLASSPSDFFITDPCSLSLRGLLIRVFLIQRDFVIQHACAWVGNVSSSHCEHLVSVAFRVGEYARTLGCCHS
jgi:hypothetical protein